MADPQVPSVGYKSTLVGPPGSGGGGGGTPAGYPPPEVKQNSEVGTDVAHYALGDHTHKSPTIYWPQGVGPNSNIQGNRVGVANSVTGFFSVNSINFGYDTVGVAGISAPAGAAILSGDAHSVGSNLSVVVGGFNSTIAAGGFNDFIGAGSLHSLSGIDSAIVAGQQSQLTGNQSFIGAGTQIVLSGNFSGVVSGSSNQVTNADFAFGGGGGGNKIASHYGSVIGGWSAQTYIPGQDAHASGATLGEEFWSQASRVVLRGSTLGVSPNETVELLPYDLSLPASALVLQSSRVYSCQCQVATKNTASGDVRSMLINAAVAVDNLGAITIAAQSTVSDIGSGTIYSITLSAGAGPTRLVVTFATGVGITEAVRVSCNLTLVEQAIA